MASSRPRPGGSEHRPCRPSPTRRAASSSAARTASPTVVRGAVVVVAVHWPIRTASSRSVRPPARTSSPKAPATLPDPIDLGAASPSEATEGRLVRPRGSVVSPSDQVDQRRHRADDRDERRDPRPGHGRRLERGRAEAFGVGGRYRIDRDRRPASVAARARRTGTGSGCATRPMSSSWRPRRRPRHHRRRSPSPDASPTPSPTGGPLISIASASGRRPGTSRSRRVVTAPASAARLAPVAGSSSRTRAAPSRSSCRRTRARRASGRGSASAGGSGTAYGAPRLRATGVTACGTGAIPAPLRVAGPDHVRPCLATRRRSAGASTTSRSSAIAGGPRSSSARIAWSSVGQPGAGSRSTALVEGRHVDGHRDRPARLSERDRPPTVAPAAVAGRHRSSGRPPSDGPGATGIGAAVGRRPGRRRPRGVAADRRTARGATSTSPTSTTSIGTTVRVGGLVVDLRPDGFTLDDGTAVGRVVLDRRGGGVGRPRRAGRRHQRRSGGSSGVRRQRRPSWSMTPAAIVARQRPRQRRGDRAT